MKRFPRITYALISLLSIGLIAATMLLIPKGIVSIILGTLFVMLVPGLFIWQTITASRLPSRVAVGYIVGLSLLSTMLGGLAINQLYIYLQWDKPLTAFNGIMLTAGIAAFFAATAAIRRPRRQHPKPILLTRRILLMKSLATAASLAVVLLAIFGAITLNNGGSPLLALLAIIGMVGLFGIAFVYQGLENERGILLYGTCLAILLSVSLRGWNITGHDIMQEYQVFQLTLTNLTWKMSYYQDAYMACLSLTILPTIMQQITGIQDQYVYKLLFQLIFAFIAPVLYRSIVQFTPPKTAMLAVLAFITFPTFLTDITMLNRQELALLFLALAISAGLEQRLRSWQRQTLGLLFLIGMVVSHYSTSYVAIGMMAGAVGLAALYGLARIIKHRHIRPPKLAGHHTIHALPIIIITGASLVLWGSVITKTSGNITQTSDQVVSSLIKLANGQGLGTPDIGSVLPSKTTGIAGYTSETLATLPFDRQDYYPADYVQQFPVEPTTETIAPLTVVGNHIPFFNRIANTLYTYIRGGYALLLQILIAIGLLVGLLTYKKAGIPRQYLLLGVASIVIMAAQILFPAAINYGLTRIIQQSLLVLSLPIVLGALWIMGLVKIPVRLRHNLLAIAFGVIFLVTSGFLPRVTGGFKPSLNLSNSGFQYSAYYTHESEIKAIEWLKTNAPAGSRVYSDEFARRKLITYGDIYSQKTLLPQAIPRDSYVFLSYGNTQFNQVAAYSGSSLVYYQPPIQFLNESKNLLYDSGSVKIYK